MLHVRGICGEHIYSGIVRNQYTISSRMGYQQPIMDNDNNVDQILCKKLRLGCGVLVRVRLALLGPTGVHSLILITDATLLSQFDV